MDALEAKLLERKPSASVRVSPTEASAAVVDSERTNSWSSCPRRGSVCHLVASIANLVDTNIDFVIPTTYSRYM